MLLISVGCKVLAGGWTVYTCGEAQTGSTALCHDARRCEIVLCEDWPKRPVAEYRTVPDWERTMRAYQPD
jgi:hypothetical protein